jgi:hypothetical protein
MTPLDADQSTRRQRDYGCHKHTTTDLRFRLRDLIFS